MFMHAQNIKRMWTPEVIWRFFSYFLNSITVNTGKFKIFFFIIPLEWKIPPVIERDCFFRYWEYCLENIFLVSLQIYTLVKLQMKTLTKLYPCFFTNQDPYNTVSFGFLTNQDTKLSPLVSWQIKTLILFSCFFDNLGHLWSSLCWIYKVLLTKLSPLFSYKSIPSWNYLPFFFTHQDSYEIISIVLAHVKIFIKIRLSFS